MLRGRDGVGEGDAKLLAASGAWLGAALLPQVILLAASTALAAAFVCGSPATGSAPVRPCRLARSWQSRPGCSGCSRASDCYERLFIRGRLGATHQRLANISPSIIS